MKSGGSQTRCTNLCCSDLEKRRILFVEDHKDTQEIVAIKLADLRLIIARDFAEGLRLAQQRYFDLYILDNWLPDGTGIELCRRIRAFDPHTPVLFWSDAIRAEDMREALSAGAQIYLTKPSNLDELKLAVTQLTSVAGERAFEARLAELAAVREELTIRAKENAHRME